MYKAGDLKITDAPCSTTGDDGDCNEWDHKHAITDSRTKNYDNLVDAAYLTHSCNEWVIGWQDQIDALIADLQNARTEIVKRTTKCEKPPPKERR